MTGLNPSQRAFLVFHVRQVPTQWRWHFADTQLRARTERGFGATICRGDLDHLVTLGLMRHGAGHLMEATSLGKDLVRGQAMELAS